MCVWIGAHLCPASWLNVLPLNVRDLLDFSLDGCGTGCGRVLETQNNWSTKELNDNRNRNGKSGQVILSDNSNMIIII